MTLFKNGKAIPAFPATTAWAGSLPLHPLRNLKSQRNQGRQLTKQEQALGTTTAVSLEEPPRSLRRDLRPAAVQGASTLG